MRQIHLRLSTRLGMWTEWCLVGVILPLMRVRAFVGRWTTKRIVEDVTGRTGVVE